MAVKQIASHGYVQGEPADIHVELSDGSRHVATFMTPEHVAAAMIDCTAMPPPYNDYVSDPSIVIVRRVDMELIRQDIHQMLEDGTFTRHFERTDAAR